MQPCAPVKQDVEPHLPLPAFLELDVHVPERVSVSVCCVSRATPHTQRTVSGARSKLVVYTRVNIARCQVFFAAYRSRGLALYKRRAGRPAAWIAQRSPRSRLFIVHFLVSRTIRPRARRARIPIPRVTCSSRPCCTNCTVTITSGVRCRSRESNPPLHRGATHHTGPPPPRWECRPGVGRASAACRQSSRERC